MEHSDCNGWAGKFDVLASFPLWSLSFSTILAMIPGMSPEPRPTRIIAVANQKGGVGKTTTTINLGSSMAEEGYRVLIVDLDPQANATTGIGVNSRDLEHSIYHVILQQATASAIRRSTDIPNLDFLPSSQSLVGAEIELVAAFSREHRLKRALAEIVDDYDIVLIDCPPALGLLTINALVVASEVLVPIQCEYYALEGLGQLVENVDRVKAHLNPDLEVSTIALVMYDARTKLSEQVAGEVRAFFGSKVCRQVIPRSVGLSEASSYGQPINVYDPRSRGAVAYRELAREVLHGPVPSGENTSMDDEINGVESGPEEVWT